MNYSKSANTKSSSPQKRKNNKKRKNSVGTLILRILVILAIVGCFAVGGAFLGAYMGILESAPIINTEDAVPESYTSIIYDADGNEIDRLHGKENREYVKLSSIPMNLQNAIVAIEDERFYQHNGVDVKGMVRALVVNIKNMDMTQGASTITQQLMKNEILTSEKKLKRKLQEQYIAVTFEKQLEESLGSKKKAKDYILELYLNTMALNHGLNGVQSASKFYFGKEVSELTLAECASIAGVTKNPSAYSPLTKPEKNKERQTTVLNKMLELNYISQSEYDEAIAEDIYANIVGKTSDGETGTAVHSYFVDSAIVELANQLQEEKGMTRQQAYNLIYSGGLQIHLTIDANMQKIMETSFANDALFPPGATSETVTYTISIMDTATEKQEHYSRELIISSQDEINPFIQSVKDELLNESNSLVADNYTVAKSLQAAMAIIDYHTGEIKAIVGGREKNGDLVFNRATQALRQPGSCFKVLAAYAPAIDLGIVTPGTLIKDEPFTYNGWSPKNWYGESYRGYQTVRAGIRDSLNILAAKTLIKVGVDTAYNYMKNFGFENMDDSDRVPAMALGGIGGISVLELTAAYGAIANAGIYNKPIYYSTVVDHNGNILIDNTIPESHIVLKETSAYLLTDMMKDVITGGGSATGTRAKFSNVKMPIAGKTGTTNDAIDLMFAGYTPYYVGGVWMGYDTPKSMNSLPQYYHMLLWKDVMEQIHTGLPTKDFERPKGIVTRNMCSASGGSPNGLCDRDFFGSTITTDLSASDAPGADTTCEMHQIVKICKESFSLPGPNCTDDHIVDIVLAIDEDGNVVNNPRNEDDTLAEGAVHVDEICTLPHALETEEMPGGIINYPNTGIDNNPTPSLPDNEHENNNGNGNEGGSLPGLTGLPGIQD